MVCIEIVTPSTNKLTQFICLVLSSVTKWQFLPIYYFFYRYSKNYASTIDIRNFRNIEPSTTKNDSNLLKTIWQKRRYEIVAYNNCFYRNLVKSRFVIPLDIDEVIVPKLVPTWNDFLQSISHVVNVDEYASLTVSNAYFFDEKKAKGSIFFFENIFRSPFSPKEESGKSFVNTKNTLSVFNHYALNVTPGVNRVYFLPPDWIQMNHYKFDCDIRLLPQCANYRSSHKILDYSLFRLRSQFNINYDNVTTELKKLHIL